MATEIEGDFAGTLKGLFVAVTPTADPVPTPDPTPDPAPITESSSPNILFVDPASGSDANDGQSRSTAKATIQAAYDVIPVVQKDSRGFPVNHRQGGLINLLEGRHDVGVGLNLLKAKEVEIVGPFRANRNPHNISGKISGTGAVIFSSQIPDYLFGIGQEEDTGQNAYGFAFENLFFEVRGKYAIKANDTNFLKVSDCSARHFNRDAFPNAWFIGSFNTGRVVGQDTSWHRITDNTINGMGLHESRAIGANGRNSNQHVLRDNVVFGGSTRTAAMIYMENSKGSMITGNNFESGAIAMEFGGPSGTISSGNHIMGNSGESVAVWLKADRFYGNMMLDSGSRSPARNHTDPHVASKLYEYTANTGHNLIIEAVSTPFGDLYDSNPGTDVSSRGNKRIDPTSVV